MDTWGTNWSFAEKTSVKQSIKQQGCSKKQMYPLTNWTESSRGQLHQSVSHIGECRHTQGRCTPTNQTYCYRGWLHQVSITYWRMQTYPGQMSPHYSNLMLQRLTTPGQYHILENADIPRADVPPLFKPSATEADYTRSVSHIGECRHT